MFNPKYQISSKIISNLSKIAEVHALIRQAKILPAREAFLRRAAIVKMAHSSTSIEGNTLSEFQIKNLLEGKGVRAEADQVREAKNYLAALHLIDKTATGKESFDEKDLLLIHQQVISALISKEKTGQFRPGPVYVVNILANGKEKIAYTAPPAKSIPGHIGDLLYWLQSEKEIHPVIRAGIFHYQFETIHPFADGNGRVGRLLTLLHLYQSGWDFRRALVLEDYYNRNRKSYYEHLQTGKTFSQREGLDLTPWLEYFTDGFLFEAQSLKEQVEVLQAAGPKQPAETLFLDKDETVIVDFVVTMGKITSADVCDILRIPKRTAQAKLNKLEKEIKLLEKTGAGPKTYYRLKNI